MVHKMLPGVAVVKSGDEINVDGIGPTLGGLYYVDEVEHTFSSSGYRQRFKLTRSAPGTAASDDED